MVEGLARFERRWRAIPQRVRDAVASEMERIADQVVADMRRLVPRKSGDLAASIGWTWGEAPKGSMTIGSVGGREYAGLKITFFAGGGDEFYGRFQEFGTQDMTANPFFFPVWRLWRRRAKSRISRAVSKAITEP